MTKPNPHDPGWREWYAFFLFGNAKDSQRKLLLGWVSDRCFAGLCERYGAPTLAPVADVTVFTARDLYGWARGLLTEAEMDAIYQQAQEDYYPQNLDEELQK